MTFLLHPFMTRHTAVLSAFTRINFMNITFVNIDGFNEAGTSAVCASAIIHY